MLDRVTRPEADPAIDDRDLIVPREGEDTIFGGDLPLEGGEGNDRIFGDREGEGE